MRAVEDRPRTVRASFLDVVVDGISCLADLALYAAVDVPGRLELGALKAALDRFSREEPVLASRFERRALRSRFVVDPEPDWPLREHREVDGPRAEELEAALVDRSFDLSDPLPVCLEVLHLPSHDRLLLRASHGIVDGGGTKRLLYGLARAYREELEGKPLPPLGSGGPRGARRLLRALRASTAGRLLAGALEDQLSLIPRGTLRVPMAPGPEGARRIARLCFESERTARLAARWRPRGVTVNDILVAAFGRALEARYGAQPGQRRRAALVVASDLRLRLPPEDHLCNLSNLRVLPLGALPLPEPEVLLRQVAARTARWKRSLAGVGHGLAVAPLLALLPHGATRWLVRRLMGPSAIRRSCSIALTNMGILSAERLDFGSGPCLDARIAAPVGRPPALIAAATGCEGRVTFSLGHRSLALPPSEVDALLAALDAEVAHLE